MRRLFFGALALALLVFGETSQVSTERLFTLLAELRTVDTSDRDVAEQFGNLRLRDRLTDESMQVLRKQADGPRTLRALELLQAESTQMPVLAEPVATLTPIPDAAKQKEIIGRISTYAGAYERALPNFLCLETTRYYTATTNHSGEWRLEQKITEDLRYKDGAEDYQTKLVNDRPSTEPVSEVRSSFTRGELGTILSETFDPSSETQFEWDHWETIGGKRLAAIRYHVARAHSQFAVCCISTGSMTVNGVRRKQLKKWISAYQGGIFADPETGVIRRFTYRNVEIPPGYNFDDARNLMDYEQVTLGGRSDWLPRRVIHYVRQGEQRKRSEIEFSGFQSFGSNSVLTFPADEK